jgi:hypothetical protein
MSFLVHPSVLQPMGEPRTLGQAGPAALREDGEEDGGDAAHLGPDLDRSPVRQEGCRRPRSSEDDSQMDVRHGFLVRCLCPSVSSSRSRLALLRLVVAFFDLSLKRNNLTTLFEDNQSDLEQAVEALSELLEKPIEREGIPALRQQVTDKTVSDFSLFKLSCSTELILLLTC